MRYHNYRSCTGALLYNRSPHATLILTHANLISGRIKFYFRVSHPTVYLGLLIRAPPLCTSVYLYMHPTVYLGLLIHAPHCVPRSTYTCTPLCTAVYLYMHPTVYLGLLIHAPHCVPRSTYTCSLYTKGD